jgi:DNA polymerase-3 subunit delta'
MRFSEFIGNKPIVEALQAAITAGRVSNAYLFAGPERVGKHTLAMICAQTLLCQAPVGEPCGECPSCRRFRADETGEFFHPDLHVVIPDGKFIRGDQVRDELIIATQMRPREGKKQVFIIDPAESMHPSAANAFLKTLEEGPGASVFFLISITPTALLPTVLSRCQRFNFQRVCKEELSRELQKRRGLEPEDALALANLSRGAVGAAMEFDLERHRRERQTALDFVKAALGNVEFNKVFSIAERMHKESELFGSRLEIVGSIVRDLMILASAGSGVAVVNEEIKEELLELARGRSPRRLASLLSLLAEMREPLTRNVRIDSVCQRLMMEGREIFVP